MIRKPKSALSAASARLRVSLVVPMHNEAKSLPALVRECDAVFATQKTLAFQYVLVNDGSTDDTMTVAADLCAGRTDILVVDLSRNFGKEVALSAGADHAHSDAVIFMDADLQHPPEIIPKLIEQWQAGGEVVIAVRRATEAKSAFRHWASRMFQKAFEQGSDHKPVAGATDFRLLDRKVVLAFRKMHERQRMFRGLVDWLGFRRSYVQFDARARLEGQASYTTAKLMRLAVDGFLSHSEAPLRLVLYTGLAIVTLSGLGLAWMGLGEQIFGAIWHYTPLAKAVVLNTGLVGVVLGALGIHGLYLAKIQREVSGRPLYAVRELLGAPEADATEADAKEADKAADANAAPASETADPADPVAAKPDP
jgi:polyisoprenyl-phosphate glycosyltransferase